MAETGRPDNMRAVSRNREARHEDPEHLIALRRRQPGAALADGGPGRDPHPHRQVGLRAAGRRCAVLLAQLARVAGAAAGGCSRAVADGHAATARASWPVTLGRARGARIAFLLLS